MKELLRTVRAVTMMAALTLSVGGSLLTSGLPRPWLTLNRTAKVLHLKCAPPQEAYDWTAVHDLRLSALLHTYSVFSNVSLVNMTSNMKEPKVHSMFDIFRVSFQGTWLSKSPSLDFHFPVEGNKLGRYFCLVVYNDPDDNLRKLTTEITVGEDFVNSHMKTPLKIKNFEASVIEAHNVKVTWMKPDKSKFQEASVSRIPVDAEGNGIAPSMSLFTTNGLTHFVYDSDLVLLDKFYEQDNNVSIDLYMKRDQHSPSFYRYSCSTPYPACTGHNDVNCTCCQPGSDPDRQTCPVSECTPCQTGSDLARQTCPPVSESYCTPYLPFLILLILCVLIIIPALSVYCLYKKNDRCSKIPLFVKIFAPKRQSTQEEEAPLTPQDPSGVSQPVEPTPPEGSNNGGGPPPPAGNSEAPSGEADNADAEVHSTQTRHEEAGNEDVRNVVDPR